MLIYILNFAFIINALVIPQLHSEASIASVNRIPRQTTNAHKEYPILCKKGFLDCFKPKVAPKKPEIPKEPEVLQEANDFSVSYLDITHRTNPNIYSSISYDRVVSSVKDQEKAETAAGPSKRVHEISDASIELPLKFSLPKNAFAYPFDDDVELNISELKKLESKSTRIEKYLAEYNEAKVQWISYAHGDNFSGKSVKIGDMDLSLLKKLGQGSFGVAYLAKTPSHNENVVVKFTKFKEIMSEAKCKFLKDSYIREKDALQITNRLISFDDKLFVTVQKEIKGENLMQTIKKLSIGQDRASQSKLNDISQKYEKLADDFLEKYGLIHGDVAPRNVILDSKGDLNLIDFGMAERVDPLSRAQSMDTERRRSAVEWSGLIQYQEVNNAIRNPADPNSRNIIDRYVANMNALGNHDEAERIRNLFNEAFIKLYFK